MATIKISHWQHKVTLRLVCAGLLMPALAACTLKSDAQYASDQSRQRNEQAVRGMQAATQQTTRGQDLSGSALTAALAGKTLVDRYQRSPYGRAEPYVVQKHFASDGRFVVVDQPREYGALTNDQDRWRVDGPRLCIKGPPSQSEWKCYRMAVTSDGALQWFIDAPGTPSHGLLTIVTREILNGPPR